MRARVAMVLVAATLATVTLPTVGSAAINDAIRLANVALNSLVSAVDPDSMRFVFAAYERDATGHAVGPQALYTVNGDGTGLHRISPNDGRYYDWPSFAMNGTKIVYSAGAQNSDHQVIYMADADGTNPVALTTNPWFNAQPKVSPDGHTLLFTSEWPDEFPKIGIFAMDLATKQVKNLTARTFAAGLDADPRYSSDASQVVFASSFTTKGPSNTQIYLMNADGTGRRKLTHDAFFDTDPALSPDGRSVIYSSYQGKNQPTPGQPNDGFKFGVEDWHLMRLDLVTGHTRSLTAGNDCTTVDPYVPCLPTEGPGWVPIWSPDGRFIAYQSIVSPIAAGLYVMNADGTGAHAVVESADLAISYWDWTVPGAAAPSGAVSAIGTRVPTDRLLFGGSVYHSGKRPPQRIFWSQPDRFVSHEIVLQQPSTSHLTVTFARWTPDRQQIVFTARVPVDSAGGSPWPAPPPGQRRHVHYTMSSLGDLFVAPRDPRQVAQDQIFMMNADGSNIRQLTDPWIEDYMDALQPGDARGNTDPDVSPNGRYMVFTNTSSIKFESFILRLDLVTGEVVNLTNVTAGAVPMADLQPRYSPDGKRIAFVSTVAGSGHITVMNGDGKNVHVITDDQYFEAFPTWSPDGRTIAFASFHGRGLPITGSNDTNGDLTVPKIRLDSWYLTRVSVASGQQRVLTGASDTPIFRPVWSPDGRYIAYITVGRTLAPDIYLIAAGGGPPMPLQLTLDTKEEFLDWR